MKEEKRASQRKIRKNNQRRKEFACSLLISQANGTFTSRYLPLSDGNKSNSGANSGALQCARNSPTARHSWLGVGALAEEIFAADGKGTPRVWGSWRLIVIGDPLFCGILPDGKEGPACQFSTRHISLTLRPTNLHLPRAAACHTNGNTMNVSIPQTASGKPRKRAVEACTFCRQRKVSWPRQGAHRYSLDEGLLTQPGNLDQVQQRTARVRELQDIRQGLRIRTPRPRLVTLAVNGPRAGPPTGFPPPQQDQPEEACVLPRRDRWPARG